MATYSELYDLRENAAMLEKIEVACWIQADIIRSEGVVTTNHAERLAWAAKVYADPKNEAYRMLPQLVAQNKSASIAQIIGAGDAAIQANVSNAVDLFAVADATP
uniref:Uncharacterized protein n=1 Tax=viral metagenome TaxID=1070528 RepID=A0A6M3L653_9ZZZZ